MTVLPSCRWNNYLLCVTRNMTSETIALILQILIIIISNPISGPNIVNTFQNHILIAMDQLCQNGPVKKQCKDKFEYFRVYTYNSFRFVAF
jgi:hypothetical protein